MEKLNHFLVNPNQVCHNNIDHWYNPYYKHHGLSIIIDGGPIIPLDLNGKK